MAKIIFNEQLRNILKENNFDNYQRFKVYENILNINDFKINKIREFENNFIKKYEEMSKNELEKYNVKKIITLTHDKDGLEILKMKPEYSWVSNKKYDYTIDFRHDNIRFEFEDDVYSWDRDYVNDYFLEYKNTLVEELNNNYKNLDFNDIDKIVSKYLSKNSDSITLQGNVSFELDENFINLENVKDILEEINNCENKTKNLDKSYQLILQYSENSFYDIENGFLLTKELAKSDFSWCYEKYFKNDVELLLEDLRVEKNNEIEINNENITSLKF